MKIKRRFPNFFSGFEDLETEHEVSSKEELMNIPWIKEYDDIPGHIGVFYSPCTLKDSPDLLMTLTQDMMYFVVGYIYGDGSQLGLENYLDKINELSKIN